MVKKSSLLVIIFCIYSSVIFPDAPPVNQQKIELTDELFPRTDPKVIGLIYQMLQVIDQLFTKHDIPYWIDGGTALGYVRHQGIIPWDDDADLIYHIEDQERILALEEEFAEYGFYVKQEKLIRVFPSKEVDYPYVDLAAYRLYKDNVYRYHIKLPPNHFYQKFYWLPSEVEPLVRVKFGPVELNAPNDMLRYLFTGYGGDCLEYATYKMPHGGDRKKVINRKVKVVDFSPAIYEIDNSHIPL